MIDTPFITRTDPQITALIPLCVGRAEIQQHMGPGMAELIATLKAQSITPAGPLFVRHLRITAELFDLQISIPVTAPIAAEGRVEPGLLPATTVARTIYRGPYEGLATAWIALRSWALAQGHTLGTDLWEIYLTGPNTSSNPEDWRTELNLPLVAWTVGG
ncbi:MAG: GyrI-like domain-containing protein [Leptothrix ochracea]|uniref:GyrI-like domain-containing protein n=1 Tax=Leptothrix ochracea TaxID=735331 RepID=UPI0034E1EAE9